LSAYNRIVEDSALEGRLVELLEGLVVEMSPQGVAHANGGRSSPAQSRESPIWRRLRCSTARVADALRHGSI
jgi:hypothetical protein